MWQIYVLAILHVTIATYASASYLDGWQVYSRINGAKTNAYVGTLGFYEKVKILKEPPVDWQLWLVKSSTKGAGKKFSVPVREEIKMQLSTGESSVLLTLFVQSL